MNDLSRRQLFQCGIACSAAVASAAAPQSQDAAPTPARERLSLDSGWRFHLGNANDAGQDFGFGINDRIYAKSANLVPAAGLNFDVSAWRPVDLPHDWAIELPFVENAPAIVEHGSYPLGRKYPATSIGWYRRVIDIPAADAGRRLALEFDGVYRDALLIFNGHYLGQNFSGYSPFRFDITDLANYGASNTLLVRVDATLNDGWFYEGAGIYRHVWLTKTKPMHVPQWGVFARATVRSGSAAVRITTEVDNDGDTAGNVRVVSRIAGPDGKIVGTATASQVSIAPWTRYAFEQEVPVAQPALWSVEEPNLYRVLTTVESAGSATDHCETSFGIRTTTFDPDKGFFLNGKPLKIKGTCNHQDHAGVGVALPDRIQSFRIEKLKEMGANAYRTSHNPPTPELMDACDRLGMMVLCETRMMDSTPEGLSQLERMIRCHRNHPSIILWSLGNEEPEQGNQRGIRTVTSMKRLAARLDGTRLVTVAMNGGFGRRGISTAVDVQGFNYSEPAVDGFHRDFPRLPVIGSETASAVSTRGIYENDKTRGYVRAYDNEKVPWGSTAESWWKFYEERPFLGGGFAWTGFDYRGEPTPYGWPCISSHFGIIDTCGFPKDTFFYYQAWWGSQPVLHLFPHWNWEGREGKEIDVWVHSNLDRVELFLNGQSQGAQNVTRLEHLAWKVKYAPGTIEARGYKGGQQVLTARRETAGAAARIVLRPDRNRLVADGADVSMVTVEIADAQGRMVPTAANDVAFRVSGAGHLLGVGNGDPSSHEPDKGDRRHAFNGLCMAIVQAARDAGEIRVEAAASGLESATAILTASARPL